MFKVIIDKYDPVAIYFIVLGSSLYTLFVFPGGSEVKVSASNAGDPGLIPGSGRSSGEGNGNPFQRPCLGNHMDRGIWQATVHGFAKASDMT